MTKLPFFSETDPQAREMAATTTEPASVSTLSLSALMGFSTYTQTRGSSMCILKEKGVWGMVVAKEFTLNILALNVRPLACCTHKRITCRNTSHTKRCATMRFRCVGKNTLVTKGFFVRVLFCYAGAGAKFSNPQMRTASCLHQNENIPSWLDDHDDDI